VREHATSVHLMLDPDMLDPDDPGRLEVSARQHPELGDTFYVTVDSGHCHITLSGPPEPLVAVVERLGAELAATLTAAGRHDLPIAARPGPADQEVGA
jgi:hypothetical protein